MRTEKEVIEAIENQIRQAEVGQREALSEREANYQAGLANGLRAALVEIVKSE